MARLARVVVPGLPHHVTQRGNRREQTFFNDGDYQLYRRLVSDAARKAKSEIWAYCLMPNHVHMIVVPSSEDGLRRTFADAHRRYTAHVNTRLNVTGHLWQGRFGSVVMDEEHLFHAVRYVSLNPVRAKLVKRTADWPWSSVRAHLEGRDDELVSVAGVLERFGDFDAYLGSSSAETDRNAFASIRRSETTGRPVGGADWMTKLELSTGRSLRQRKRGPKGV